MVFFWKYNSAASEINTLMVWTHFAWQQKGWSSACFSGTLGLHNVHMVESRIQYQSLRGLWNAWYSHLKWPWVSVDLVELWITGMEMPGWLLTMQLMRWGRGVIKTSKFRTLIIFNVWVIYGPVSVCLHPSLKTTCLSDAWWPGPGKYDLGPIIYWPSWDQIY